ncbi:hypothetical protein FBU30_004325 [Linnemannia zychae]|nr:hypothetical protein FBU30_004325 [Linnemannia zychae]
MLTNKESVNSKTQDPKSLDTQVSSHQISTPPQQWTHINLTDRSSHTVKPMTDYNRKATFQRAAAANMLKYIVEAVKHLPLSPSDRYVRVLENACSHGVNSVDFALAICQAVAARDAKATVSITFNDLPDNDFDKVLGLISNSDVANFHPTLHTLGKSMFSLLMEPESLDMVYSCMGLHWMSSPSWLTEESFQPSLMAKQAQVDLDMYVSSRHKELRKGGQLVLSFPGVHDGSELGINTSFPREFKRAQAIIVERGVATWAWTQKYCRPPVYSRNRDEVKSAFDNADWTIHSLELHDIEEYGASDYRAGRITMDEIAHRCTDMVISVCGGSLKSIWVEYGGMTKDQAVNMLTVYREAMLQAQKESNTLRVYPVWVVVATKNIN